MRIAAGGLCALWLALPVAAATEAPGAANEMRQIFALSGLEAQLGSLDQLVAASLSPSLQNMPAAQAAVVKRAVLTEFSDAALQQQVESRLARAHQPAHAAAALRWLRSPLGRRITELESAATSVDGLRALTEFAQQLASQPPPATRVALARELDRAVGASEFALEVALGSARAAMSAVSGARPGEPRLAPDQIEAAISSQREALRSQLQETSLISVLYSYQSLSDAELEIYVAFSRGDAGRWYHGVVKQALLEVLTEVAGRMSRSVATALRSVPAPGPAPVPARRAQ